MPLDGLMRHLRRSPGFLESAWSRIASRALLALLLIFAVGAAEAVENRLQPRTVSKLKRTSLNRKLRLSRSSNTVHQVELFDHHQPCVIAQLGTEASADGRFASLPACSLNQKTSLLVQRLLAAILPPRNPFTSRVPILPCLPNPPPLSV